MNEKLFQPYKLGPSTLGNRMVMEPVLLRHESL
jgi:2,4-dienoyl-CoA reductase-like NADH-dependent reductase (Old Yellow Enzyme family)